MMELLVNELRVDELAEIIWNYHLLHHRLEKADCIFVLGSHDPNTAEYAIDLFLEGWAPYLIFSGGTIHPAGVLKNDRPKSEAESFQDIALKRGVPSPNILVENRSSNTGENFQYTGELLKSLGLEFKKFIVVQKPYMERRTYATGMVHWTESTLILASQPISYHDYVNKNGLDRNRFINTMVGDLQRIRVYPSMGFQIYQEIPSEVWTAFEELVKLGYDKRLIR